MFYLVVAFSPISEFSGLAQFSYGGEMQAVTQHGYHHGRYLGGLNSSHVIVFKRLGDVFLPVPS